MMCLTSNVSKVGFSQDNLLPSASSASPRDPRDLGPFDEDQISDHKAFFTDQNTQLLFLSAIQLLYLELFRGDVICMKYLSTSLIAYDQSDTSDQTQGIKRFLRKILFKVSYPLFKLAYENIA